MRRAAGFWSGKRRCFAGCGERRRYGVARAEKEARQGPAKHRLVAGASATLRAGDRTCIDVLPVLRGPDASDRRGDAAKRSTGSGVVARVAHDPPQIRLPRLRGSDRPGHSAGAARRGRHGDDGADRSHRYGQVRWQSTLYRQAQILAGHGVVVDRQTLARWMGSAAWMAKGLYDLQLKTNASLRAAVLRRDADAGARSGTRPYQDLPVLGACRRRSGLEGSAAGGRLRVRGGPRQEGDRGATGGFEGVLQVDGYAAYVSLAGDAKMSGKIRLAYCLVHARRNFVKVHKTTNSPFAREVIERIGAVYAIEERIRGLDADERRAVRQAETKPLMEALKARLEAVKDGISRQSTLIKAIDYMLERWEGLTAFLDDGRLEPDTNTVERSIRPIAIGKKNILFSGDEGGGETWAILSSLLNTCSMPSAA